MKKILFFAVITLLTSNGYTQSLQAENLDSAALELNPHYLCVIEKNQEIFDEISSSTGNNYKLNLKFAKLIISKSVYMNSPSSVISRKISNACSYMILNNTAKTDTNTKELVEISFNKNDISPLYKCIVDSNQEILEEFSQITKNNFELNQKIVGLLITSEIAPNKSILSQVIKDDCKDKLENW